MSSSARSRKRKTRTYRRKGKRPNRTSLGLGKPSLHRKKNHLRVSAPTGAMKPDELDFDYDEVAYLIPSSDEDIAGVGVAISTHRPPRQPLPVPVPVPPVPNALHRKIPSVAHPASTAARVPGSVITVPVPSSSQIPSRPPPSHPNIQPRPAPRPRFDTLQDLDRGIILSSGVCVKPSRPRKRKRTSASSSSSASVLGTGKDEDSVSRVRKRRRIDSSAITGKATGTGTTGNRRGPSQKSFRSIDVSVFATAAPAKRATRGDRQHSRKKRRTNGQPGKGTRSRSRRQKKRREGRSLKRSRRGKRGSRRRHKNDSRDSSDATGDDDDILSESDSETKASLSSYWSSCTTSPAVSAVPSEEEDDEDDLFAETLFVSSNSDSDESTSRQPLWIRRRKKRYLHSKGKKKMVEFRSDVDLQVTGKDSFVLESLEEIMEGLMGNLADDEEDIDDEENSSQTSVHSVFAGEASVEDRCGSLMALSNLMKKQGDARFGEFVRSHGLLQELLGLLTSVVENEMRFFLGEGPSVPTSPLILPGSSPFDVDSAPSSHSSSASTMSVGRRKLRAQKRRRRQKKKVSMRGLSWILAVQLLSRILLDSISCKFVPEFTFVSLLNSVKLHPLLLPSSLRPGSALDRKRSVRRRRATLVHAPGGDEELEEDDEGRNALRRVAVSHVLKTLLHLMSTVPFTHQLIVTCDTKSTIEALVQVLVCVIDGEEELSDVALKQTTTDMSNTLNLLRFASFDLSRELKTVLPSLTRLLNALTQPQGTKILANLASDHPAIDCITTTLNMLTNLTNKNRTASRVVAYEQGIHACLRLFAYNVGISSRLCLDPVRCGGVHFDVTVSTIGLLVNLTEENADNRNLLSSSKMVFSNGDELDVISYLLSLHRLKDVEVEDHARDFKILSGYGTLLLGCLLKDHPRNRTKCLRMMGRNDFQPLERTLKEFLAFKNKAKMLTQDVLEGVERVLAGLQVGDGEGAEE